MPDQPCRCDAYPFPHRIGGGKCYANLVCAHGVLTSDHPDYDRLVDHCQDCEREEYADWQFDQARA